jgi:hypothetical protein
VVRRDHEEGAVLGDEPRRHAARHVRLVLDDDVDLVAKEARVVGGVDFSELDLDVGMVRANGAPTPLLASATLAGAGAKSGAVGWSLVGGMLAAMVVDDAIVANEDIEPRRTRFTLAPSFDPKTRAASVGVIGVF